MKHVIWICLLAIMAAAVSAQINTTEAICNNTYAAGTYGAALQGEYCEAGENMYIALGIFVFMALAGFFGLGYYINTLRINLERMTVEDTTKSLFRIKTEMVIRSIAVLASFLLLMTVVGFAYYIAQELNDLLAQLVMVYWIICFIGITVMFVFMLFKMFTFPFNVIGEVYEGQKRHFR